MNGLCVVPAYREIEYRCPQAAYRAAGGENSYILESCEGPEKAARYSFIGYEPAAKIVLKDGGFRFKVFDKSLRDVQIEGNDPLGMLRNVMSQFKTTKNAPGRFYGGFVGYLSYDIVRYYNRLEDAKKDDLGHPEAELLLTKNNLVFDHVDKKAFLVSNSFMETEKEPDAESILNEAYSRLEGFSSQENKMTKRVDIPSEVVNYSSNTEKAEYESCVRKAKEYIKDGHIFQVVLSQRLETDYCGDAMEFYSALRRINPSPYMYCVDLGERKVVGSSPEMLVRVENRRVETFPIAGTRKRGQTPEEDARLGQEMLSDEKERAEHVMLVDLGRNDIGRIAEYGSVKVERFMDVEKYSHVQHIVSEVSGTLREGMDGFDALKSIFPAGTVSGAPKVRAMEIIDELEPTRRGVYAGAVGYFSFNGNLDTAIAIRTAVLEKGKAYVQAGAGIVADSNPEAEYKETLKKAMGMLKALGAAR